MAGSCVVGAAAASIGLMSAGLAPATAGLIGLGGYVAAAQLHAWSQRRRDRAKTASDLAVLKREAILTREELEIFKEAATAEIEKLEAAQAHRERRIVSETKVLESLIRQFAESIVGRLKAVETEQAAHGAEARRLRARLDARPAPEPPAPDVPDSALVDAVQRALIENRVDVHLQPIVQLPQRRLRFYEALTRLRDDEGRLIMPAQYMRVAEPAGLMSTIDNLLLFRSVQFVRKLTARHKDLGVFCNVAPASLEDQGFFPQFLDYLRAHRDLAGQIVFEIGQKAFDAASPSARANLKFLQELGHAIALDKVETLAVDFDELRRRGVRYVKATPAVLTDPDLKIAGGIRPEDFREYLARFGIALIGEKIETERQVVDLLDYGVDFGQGFLFGEPRPMKEEQLEMRERPAVQAAARPEPKPEPAAALEPPPQPRQAAALAALIAAQQARKSRDREAEALRRAG